MNRIGIMAIVFVVLLLVFAVSVVCATTVTLEWSGNDVLSGIKSVDIMWRFNGGVWTKYQTCSADVNKVKFIVGNAPGLYEFASVGRDVAGNIEPLPSTPDTSFTITLESLTTATIAREPAYTAGLTNDIRWVRPVQSGVLTELRWERVGYAGTSTTLTSDSGYVVQNLVHAGRYRYSVRYVRVDGDGLVTSFGPWSTWTYSTQDNEPPNTILKKTDVIGPMLRNWGMLE